MTILSWIAAALRQEPEGRREQELQGLGADLRKLRAEAEALRAKGRVLRQEIAAALSAGYATSAIEPSSSRIAQ